MESESKASRDEKPVTSRSPTSSTQSAALTPPRSPQHKIRLHCRVPSPIPTRRNRTTSQSRMAAESPLQYGVCKVFCRNKGHGFITPDNGEEDIFVHISDIEGEYVLKEGDRVEFRTIYYPPKEEKKQAVEVVITQMHGSHVKWWSNS